MILIHITEGGPPNPELKNIGSGRYERVQRIELSPEDLIKKYEELSGKTFVRQEPTKLPNKLNGFYFSGNIYLNSELPDIENKIEFGEKLLRNSKRGVYDHEMGHYIYEKKLTLSERISWEKSYKKFKSDYWRTQISSRASENANEAFAELYSGSKIGIDFSNRLRANKLGLSLFNDIYKRVEK